MQVTRESEEEAILGRDILTITRRSSAKPTLHHNDGVNNERTNGGQ